MTKEVEIHITLMVPTSLRMKVSWDENDDRVEIHRIERDMIQDSIVVQDIYEQYSEGDLEYIEEKAAEALGIERD